MELSEMTGIRRDQLQTKIDSELKHLQELANPIGLALGESGLKFESRVKCLDTVPHKVKIYVRKPKIRIDIANSGYTLYDGHEANWSYLHMRDLDLKLAIEHLAMLIAKSLVKTPCK